MGARVTLPEAARADELLFGEAPSRILVTAAPGDVERLMQVVGEWAIPARILGEVGGDRLELRMGDAVRVSLAVETLADAFENGLARALEQPIEALSGREAEGAA
jgi:phosphoribosylformylglycinamidine synthase